MISLVVNGTEYRGFTSVQASRALDTISGEFSFEAVSSENIQFPIQRGSSCQVKVDGTPVITGFVEEIDESHEAFSHSISIKGRDKTQDVIDSTLDGSLEFKAPITLQTVIQRTLSSINASGIGIVNRVGGLEPFKKGELVSPQVGQGAFDFLEQYARKRQVLLTTDGQGNIVVTRAGDQKISLVLKNIADGQENNIKKGKVNYNDSDRYHTYICKSQGNVSTLDEQGENFSSKNVTTRNSQATDPSIRSSRVFVFSAEQSSTKSQLKNRALWEANVRRARSFKYVGTVVGHKAGNDGPVWAPGMLVKIIDDFADVNAELVINKAIYTLSTDSGSETSLELLYKDSYLPEPIKEQSGSKPNANNFGGEFNE